jgi:DNA topoisomerase-6 subunit B
MFSQMSTGTTTQVITGTEKGETFSCEVSIDVKRNDPKISNYQTLKKHFRGLAVKANFKGVKFQYGEQSPLEYLRRTAIANPHVSIKFIAPDGQKYDFKRTSNVIPKKSFEVRPHPKGVTVDELITYSKSTPSRKVNSFLKTEFDRMGDKAIGEITKNVSFDVNKDPKQLAWDEAEEVVKLFKKIDFIAPRMDTLRPIGDQRVEKSMKSIVAPEFISVVTRRPTVYSGGFPFQVEAAIAYGGKAGRSMGEEKKIEIMRFANKAPLLFDAGGCAITKAVQSIDWKRYGIKDPENAPLTVFVNLISVHIPYTSAGKQAISDEDEIMEELRLAIMDSARRTSKYIIGKLREKEKQMKKELFYKYIPEIAQSLGHMTKDNEEALKKKLAKLVLDKLRLEEQMENGGIAPKEDEAPIEEEVEEEEGEENE